MALNFNKDNYLILLYKNMPQPKASKKYDIVLSPQFYVVKKEELPIKYSFQAKKLASSVLEDYLDIDKNYKFIVFKEGNLWNFYAYDPKEIEEYLEYNYGIKASQIGKIYFADQLKSILSRMPIGLNKKYAITLLDNYATIAPRDMIKAEKYIRFTQNLRPKKGFNYHAIKKEKEKRSFEFDKYALISAVLLLFLGFLFLLDGLGYKKALSQKESKINALFEHYPALKSSLSRKAIKQKYEKIEKRERKIREYLATFSKLSSKKTILQNLQLQNNKIVATFKVDPREFNKISMLLKDLHLKYKFLNNIVTLEGEL